MNVQVLVDDRETRCGLAEALRRMEGVAVEMHRLEFGDCHAEGWVFERKTLRDFAASLADGRLLRQGRRLAGCGRQAVLVLEGGSADADGLRVRREAIQGALISLMLIYGIPVLRSSGVAETARLICYAAQQLRRCALAAAPRPGRRPRRRERQVSHVLQGFPGIGPTRAASLLAQFGSLQDVVCAEFEELTEAKGLGIASARAIYDLSRRRYGPPGTAVTGAILTAGTSSP